MRDKRLGIIMLMLITTFVGFGIIIPVLPELIKEASPNMKEVHLGLMLSVYSAVSFLCSPFWGGLSDRIGRRPIILTGVLGFAASFLIFGIADGHLTIMYLSRIIGGIFSGAVTSVIVAYVSDITTVENRTKGMGIVGMSIGLGFMIGPGVGGLLSIISLNTPFYVASALALVTFVLTVTSLPESLSPEQRQPKNVAQPRRWTAFTGSVKYLYTLILFLSFSLAGLEATLQLFGMQRFDVTPVQVGIMFLLSGLVGAFVQGYVVRKVIKPGQEAKYIAFGLIASGIAFFLLTTSHQLWTATIYLALFSLGNSLIRPCATSLITQKTTVGTGVAAGLSSSMDSLGRITGPLLGTFLFTFHIELPYIVGGILSISALMMVWGFIRSTRATAVS